MTNAVAEVQDTAAAASSPASTLIGQPMIDYLGTHLLVNYVRSAGHCVIVLTNDGPLDIPADSHWTIYFNHAGGMTN